MGAGIVALESVGETAALVVEVRIPCASPRPGHRGFYAQNSALHDCWFEDAARAIGK
jgi:hypothetical protein